MPTAVGGELDILKTLLPLGVGGVLAWGMFLLYRKDATRYADDLKAQLETERRRGDSTERALVSNTAAITELVTFLKTKQAGR
jgi:hypothetical protein